MPVHPNKEWGVELTVQYVTDYVMNPAKTNGGLFVSGYECEPDMAAEDFLLSRDEYFYRTGRDQGEKEILLKTETFEKSYPVEVLVPVSTIGAGDNFNAGLIYGLMQEKLLLEDLKDLSENQWDKLIESGKRFAAEVCRSLENYVGNRFKP
jgi:sugar/nucleoside kinase (ribokinase family)